MNSGLPKRIQAGTFMKNGSPIRKQAGMFMNLDVFYRKPKKTGVFDADLHRLTSKVGGTHAVRALASSASLARNTSEVSRKERRFDKLTTGKHAKKEMATKDHQEHL